MVNPIVYDEPSGRLHWIKGLAEYPDPHNPKMRYDPRVWVAHCGLVIAMIGHPKNKPAHLVECEDCLRKEQPMSTR